MKLILRADVENLGTLGNVVNVKPGYGRNYLLPQGLAMTASPCNLKNFELERKKLEVKMNALRAQAQDIEAKLEALRVVIPMRVGENGKLYGSVTTAIIGDAFDSAGVETDRRRILLDTPIRSLGEHQVRVRLHAGIIATVLIEVVSDQQPEEEGRAVQTGQSDQACPAELVDSVESAHQADQTRTETI
ncbi:MAG: 50S ribosomal protein L9 [Desulfovibrio sp.]|jgi:large subunit ribosomal protein L9|nr:50S ribosomal protein L9 [Desulfovibrio sp.]